MQDQTKLSALYSASKKTGDTPSGLISHKTVLDFHHFFDIENPSEDEIMFLLCLRDFGFSTATYLAARFHWQHQRPLRALLAMMYGRDKSYTKRSAAHKRPSSSRASSRKRSSGA